MSNSTVDYAELLREAIKQARANAPRAVHDLLRCASQANEAVAGVTGGAAVLELAPINQGENAEPTYQLQLRKVDSEAPPSDLGVYSVSAAGYPIRRWYSRNAWEVDPEKSVQEFLTVMALENHFKWMVSTPDSRLVLLVTFFQQNGSAPPKPANGRA
ncbi:hypothetical protein [Fimbriiglobus ruber]|uniref:Uncharacterized protein n=1 Tax=Fimbriiglobus ruber TaxID=1908690 RepID=A0A225DNE0_9BACT|nr:hypothetical protein [Fimbriiglobus ruber]OWK37697.1 hypothetical protein FRUB_06817 [Fimbriiglobus ruber]